MILTTLLLLLHAPSAEVSMKAAIPVWKQFGLEKKVDYSIRGGHPHCQLPKEQYGIVEDFIDRFLLKKGMQ